MKNQKLQKEATFVLTPREQRILALIRQAENSTLKQTVHLRSIQAHVVSPRQKKLLDFVAQHPGGLDYVELINAMKRIGYKRHNVIGGFFKGKNATLVKIKIPSKGEQIFLTERGGDLLQTKQPART